MICACVYAEEGEEEVARRMPFSLYCTHALALTTTTHHASDLDPTIRRDSVRAKQAIQWRACASFPWPQRIGRPCETPIVDCGLTIVGGQCLCLALFFGQWGGMSYFNGERGLLRQRC